MLPGDEREPWEDDLLQVDDDAATEPEPEPEPAQALAPAPAREEPDEEPVARGSGGSFVKRGGKLYRR